MTPNGTYRGAITAPVLRTTGQVAAGLLASLITVGCGPGTSETPQDLVQAVRWEANRQDLDPQAAHAPAEIICPPATYRVDGLPPREAFEVTTGDCNFMSAFQPSLFPVAAGARVRIVVWHLDLDATLPGPAHAAISIDGHVIWEIDTAAPAAANLFDVTIDAPAAADVGAPIVFHVHNHGTNDWNLQTVTVTNPDT